MIRVTRLDGSQMYLNEDLIEIIEETPDTHITLTNGKRYLVRERASVLIEQIVCFRARVIAHTQRGRGRKSLHKGMAGSFRAVFVTSDAEWEK
jgi:flagellar protein FlbD